MTEAVHKGNLKSKIIRLSTKLGESSTVDKTAEMPEEEKEALKQQLDEARRGKLATKMFQATKALKSNMKKSKSLEIQKQMRKVKDARTALDNTQPDDAMEVDKDEKGEQEVSAEKKKGKATTVEDVARYEKELEILKQINVDTLGEKTLRNKVLKHPELKHQSIVIDTLPPAPESNTTNTDLSLDEKTMISTVESRILRHKSVQATIAKLLEEILKVVRPPPKAQPAPTTNDDNKNKKRDQQDYRSKRDAKRMKGEDPALTASSTFVESLNADEVRNKKKRGDDNDDFYDDEEFDEIYNGEKKKNRPGQRQRRQQYEKQYGRNANHLKRTRDETRLLQKKGKGRRDTTAAAAAAAAPSGTRGGDNHKTGLLKPEEFHPSWQAKRQEQEMIAKALSGGGAPSNNKIVFGDDSD